MGPMRASERIVMCTLSCAVLLWVSHGGRRAAGLDPCKCWMRAACRYAAPLKCACCARRRPVPCRSVPFVSCCRSASNALPALCSPSGPVCLP